MHKMTRRDLLKGAAMGSVGLVLAGCAAPAGTGSTGATTAGAGESGVEAAELVIGCFYPVDQTAGWSGLVDRFGEEHPGVSIVTQVTPWDEYLPKLLTQLAAGTPPDVLGVENTPFIRFVDKDVLLDLTPFLEDDPVFSADDFFPKLIDRYVIDGRAYGIPYDVQPKCCLFYNKGIFDTAGVDYPQAEWTWDDLFAAAQEMTVVEGDRTSQYGFHTYGGIHELFFIYSNGGAIVDDVKNPTTATLEDPKTVEGVQYWADLINEYGVSPNASFFQGAGQGAGDLFSTGRLAMFLGGYWEFVFDPDKFKQVDLGLQIGPSGPNGDHGYATGGTAYSIGNGSSQTDLAWEFVKFFMGMPGYEAAVAEAKYGVIYPPAYLPAYNSPVFAQHPEPPIENMTINGDAAEWAVFEPHHPNWLEIRSTIIGPMSELIANGDKGVAEGLAEIQPQVQAMLDKEPS